jgi:serine/threonine/tyrosine-interacting protein
MHKLIPYFPESRNFIQCALSVGGKIFVHCNSGIVRAPTFLIAYLMEVYQLPFQDAQRIVQEKRYCIDIPEHIMIQLKEYEPIFRARASMNHLSYTSGQFLQQGSRRRPAESMPSTN